MKFNKLAPEWVPYQLTGNLKQRGVDACEERFRCIEYECDGFQGRNVTGDKTWVQRCKQGAK